MKGRLADFAQQKTKIEDSIDHLQRRKEADEQHRRNIKGIDTSRLNERNQKAERLERQKLALRKPKGHDVLARSHFTNRVPKPTKPSTGTAADSQGGEKDVDKGEAKEGEGQNSTQNGINNNNNDNENSNSGSGSSDSKSTKSSGPSNSAKKAPVPVNLHDFEVDAIDVPDVDVDVDLLSSPPPAAPTPPTKKKSRRGLNLK